MEDNIVDFIIRAYNANERRNYYEVKKNLKLAIKYIEKFGINLEDLKSDVDNEMEAHV